MPSSSFLSTIDFSLDVGSINIPKSKEYVTNSNGQILHVRTWNALSHTQAKPKAIVFFLHGYSSHCNRPTHQYLAKEFNDNDIVYITLDFHGHGYSDGVRALVASYVDLVDDFVSLLLAVYSNWNADPDQNYNILQNYDKSVPFFIVGHSMGGAIAILAANFLTQSTFSQREINSTAIKWKEICAAFKGCLLFCPAVFVDQPPFFVRLLMTYVLVPLFPETEIPSGFTSLSDHSLVWESADYYRYVKADTPPAGLSWGGNLRFQTGLALLNAADEVKASINKMTFPFVVFHDPDDKVCRVQGSEMLIMESKLVKEDDKEIVRVVGGRHDLIANRLEDMAKLSVDWINKRLLINVI